jgi:hypothetical protein
MISEMHTLLPYNTCGRQQTRSGCPGKKYHGGCLESGKTTREVRFLDTLSGIRLSGVYENKLGSLMLNIRICPDWLATANLERKASIVCTSTESSSMNTAVVVEAWLMNFFFNDTVRFARPVSRLDNYLPEFVHLNRGKQKQRLCQFRCKGQEPC